MELGDALAAAFAGRPFRFYPALLSTEADALAWAREGAPHGSVVTAGYQASPRGRAGWEWEIGEGLAFSVVLRPTPRIPAAREGWLYTVAVSGLADALGRAARIEWPDGVTRDEANVAAVGVHVELGPLGVDWAVVNVLVRQPSPEPELLARIVASIEERLGSSSASVLADYLRRCETIGRDVRARLVPLRPGGPEVTGKAVSSSVDGSLVIMTSDDRRVAVPPPSLGVLEPLLP